MLKTLMKKILKNKRHAELDSASQGRRVNTPHPALSSKGRGQSGFTLAEVLITLGIIGVVAAITIPTLMNNTGKSKDYNAMKKAYSTISSAASLIRNENAGSMAGLATSSASLAALFKPYLRVLKSCNDASDSQDCYVSNDTPIKNLTGTANMGGTINYYKNWPKFIVADGMVYMFELKDTNCGSTIYTRNEQGEFCGDIEVDINGVQKPNTFGKDIFAFSINKYNVTPYKDMSNENDYCNPSSIIDVWNGADCAYRAIEEGGIKYY